MNGFCDPGLAHQKGSARDIPHFELQSGHPAGVDRFVSASVKHESDENN
jgi:hypothetical protein